MFGIILMSSPIGEIANVPKRQAILQQHYDSIERAQAERVGQQRALHVNAFLALLAHKGYARYSEQFQP